MRKSVCCSFSLTVLTHQTHDASLALLLHLCLRNDLLCDQTTCLVEVVYCPLAWCGGGIYHWERKLDEKEDPIKDPKLMGSYTVERSADVG
jgi:hypothetical protein